MVANFLKVQIFYSLKQNESLKVYEQIKDLNPSFCGYNIRISILYYKERFINEINLYFFRR